MDARHTLARLHVLLAFSCAPLFAQAVHVVDQGGGPGAEFASINAALSAAASGDLVLVRDGFYPESLTLPATGVSLVAEAGADVVVYHVDVDSLPSGRAVLVRGIEMAPDAEALGSFGDFSARVEGSGGRVWFEGCHFASLPVVPTFQTSGGVMLEGSEHVVLSACTVDPPQVSGPLPGIFVRDAHAFVFESSSRGDAPFVDAVQVTDGQLFFSGSSAVGGDGVNNTLFCSQQNGTDGLVVEGDSVVELLEPSLAGGAAGEPCGQPGQPLVVTSGSVTTTPGTAHGLVTSGPAREGQPVTATIDGAPGDRVWLSISTAPGGPRRGSKWDGPLLLESPLVTFFAGTIGPSGELVLNGVAPQLAEGAEFQTWTCQAWVLRVQIKRFALSAPATLVVLDAAL